MKKVMMLVVMAMVAVTTMAQVQEKKGGPVKPEKRSQKLTTWMKQEINLTAAQEPKVYAINLTAIKNLMQLKKDSAISQEVKKQRAKEIQKVRVEQLKSVLTPEQQELLKAKLKERKLAKRSEKGKAGKAPKGSVSKTPSGFQLTDDELEEVID